MFTTPTMLPRRYCWILKTPNILTLRKYSDRKLLTKETTPPGFVAQLAQLLEIEWKKSRNIVSDHRKLLITKYADIVESVRLLETLNYNKADICTHPTLLYTSAFSLKNRHRILHECGCLEVSASTLSKYVILANREIRIIKAHGIIPNETNVAQKLIESLPDVHLNVQPQLNDSLLLRAVRETVLNLYLMERLAITKPELEKLWHSYNRIRNKSFQSISQMIAILTDQLNFSADRIKKNAFVLYADPENVGCIIDQIKTIGDEDIREILFRRPKIMMVSYSGLKKIIEHVTSFGIAENAINKCLDILTLGPDTVQERLQDIETIEEFRVLKSNPRILRLVHYQTKARRRLDYLNQLKVKCASLHLLSSHNESFVRYTKDGSDKGKGCDAINYLVSVLKRSHTEIREGLVRHPNWCHVPTVTVTQSYEFLVNKMFRSEDIFPNLQILLYPVKRINEKLIYLQNDDAYREMKLETNNCMTVTNQQMLALCLYLIELEFHFTGDGIWTDQDLHPVENFNSILPDFPDSWKKGFKYGTKPITFKDHEIQLTI